MLLLKIVNKSFFLHKLATYDYTKNLFRNIKILKFVKKEILKFPRQALHAEKLEFIHPTSGKKVNYSAKIPKDLIQLIKFLKNLNE